MFSWRLSQYEEGEWEFETIRPDISDARSVLGSLVRRMLGDLSALGVAPEKSSPR
jgi:hypothetical protein